MSVKHPTASVFVFARSAGGWRLALIHHPRFRRWMVPGGHVEPGENPAETARREVAEEAGLTITLLAVAGTPPPPASVAGQLVPLPWWIVEEDIPAGTEPHREPRSHVHVDAWYVALAADPGSTATRGPGAEELAWWDVGDLAGLEMFDGTRVAARWLFANIDCLANPPPGRNRNGVLPEGQRGSAR